MLWWGPSLLHRLVELTLCRRRRSCCPSADGELTFVHVCELPFVWLLRWNSQRSATDRGSPWQPCISRLNRYPIYRFAESRFAESLLQPCKGTATTYGTRFNHGIIVHGALNNRRPRRIYSLWNGSDKHIFVLFEVRLDILISYAYSQRS